MADAKTIGISALISLGIVLAGAVTIQFFENPKYYCEAKQAIMECNSLSGGSQTRCYLNSEKTSWSYCSTGWTGITNDLAIQENETKETNQIPSELKGERIVCISGGCYNI